MEGDVCCAISGSHQISTKRSDLPMWVHGFLVVSEISISEVYTALFLGPDIQIAALGFPVTALKCKYLLKFHATLIVLSTPLVTVGHGRTI